MPTARHGLGSGVANGRWYVIGGGLLSGGGTFSSLTNIVEAFAPGPSSAEIPPADRGRLTNVSILATIGAPPDSVSVGFVVGGEGTTGVKPLLIRAVGPSLAPLIGVPVLDDPRFELFSGTGRVVENDNWGGAMTLAEAMAGVGAFPLSSAASRDAAFLGAVPKGDYSTRITGAGSGTGAVLAEIYETPPEGGFTATTPRLLNVSVLKPIGSGLTLGFVVGGATPRAVLIRAIGPTLALTSFNVGGAVADPQLALFGGTTKIAENNDWGGTPALMAAFASAGAFALPADSKDAALIATLLPGNYTVQVSGVGGATGITLVEAYELR
jgi:hypothetical protein